MNTNSKEVYTGTLDGLSSKIEEILEAHFPHIFEDLSVFQQYDREWTYENVTFDLIIDLSALGGNPNFHLATSPQYKYIFYWTTKDDVELQFNSTTEITTMVNSSGVNNLEAYVDINGNVTDVSPYAPNITYTLTIYFHEMPN